MSDPFRTLIDHQHSVHVALRTLFEQCLKLTVQGSLPRTRLRAGITDAIVALRAHHDYEEALLLPKLREAGHEGPWEQVEAEHQTLQDHLTALESAPAGRDDDVSDLEAPLAAIVEILGPHFEAEEAALTESDWRTIFDNDVEAARAFGKQVSTHNREGLKPATRLLPLLLYNLDGEARTRFTDRMPGFLIDGLVPYAFRPSWRSRRPFMAYAPDRWTPAVLRGWRGR